MNELQVRIDQEPGVIRFNNEELKAELTQMMERLRGAVFLEEDKQYAKGELANLRKLREAIEKRRKEVKSQCMVPYNDFEKKVKEMLAIIDEPIALIDQQLKEIEANRVRQRKEEVSALWQKMICGTEAEDFLPLEAIYDQKWNNATTSLKAVEDALAEKKEQVEWDLQLIRQNASDVQDEAIGIYRRTRDIRAALSHINTYESNKKKALELEAERRRQEEERRKQEEIRRAIEADRQYQADIEKVKQNMAQAAAETQTPAAEPRQEELPFTVNEENDELPFETADTVTVTYKVVATHEELDKVEMIFNSFGIFFERRDA